jgi:hypothetical protein
MANNRIPKYIDLPFGYEVEIRQLSHKAFVEECGEDCYAMWEVGDNGGIVYLDKSRDIKKRRADLAHEVIHAVADWQVKVLGSDHADVKD